MVDADASDMISSCDKQLLHVARATSCKEHDRELSKIGKRGHGGLLTLFTVVGTVDQGLYFWYAVQ